MLDSRLSMCPIGGLTAVVDSDRWTVSVNSGHAHLRLCALGYYVCVDIIVGNSWTRRVVLVNEQLRIASVTELINII